MSAAAAATDSTAAAAAPVMDPPRVKRRPRVAVACKRCKHRKQKCNGQTPCSNCLDFGLGEACEYPAARARPTIMTTSSQQQDADQEQTYLPPPPPPLPNPQKAPMAQEYHHSWDQAPQAHPLSRDQVAYSHNQTQLLTPPDATAVRPSMGSRVAALESVLQNEPVSTPSPRTFEGNHAVPGVSPSGRSNSGRLKTPFSPAVSSSSTSRSPQHGVALKSVRDIISELKLARDMEPPPTGHIASMGEMISVVKSARSFDITTYSRHKWEHLSLPPLRGAPSPPSEESTGFPPVEVANLLFKAYIDNVSPLHPILQTPFLGLVHQERNTNTLNDVFLSSVLHLIYAIGSTYLKDTGNMLIRGFDADPHIEAALCHLEDILLPQNIRSVQFLLVLAIYSLRRHGVTNAWTYADLAMRRCEEIGLHRKASFSASRTPLQSEVQKRVFWTAYSLDRQICGVLGRSPTISDAAIDVELPVDIDEFVQDHAAIEAAQREASISIPGMVQKSSTLSSFIHICRIRVMESQIRGSIASPDIVMAAT